MPREVLKKNSFRGGIVKIAHKNTATQLVIYAHGGLGKKDGRVRLQNGTKIYYYTVHNGSAVGDPVYDAIRDNPQMAKSGNIQRPAQFSHAQALERVKADPTLDVMTEMKKTESVSLQPSEIREGVGDETMFNYFLQKIEKGSEKLEACRNDPNFSDDLDVGINDGKTDCHVSDFIDLAGSKGHIYKVIHLVACRNRGDQAFAIGGHPTDS